MSRKTRKLIWSAPLVAVLAVAGVLAAFAAFAPGVLFADELPDAAQSLTVKAAEGNTGRTTLVLNWEAPPSGAPDMYRIDVSKNNQKFTFLTEVSGTALTYDHVVRPRGMDSEMKPGWKRYYRVYAKNSHGYGGVSTSESATTKAQDVPGEVVSVKYLSSDPDQITVNWAMPDDGGSDILGYCVRVWPTGTSETAPAPISDATCLDKFASDGPGGSAGDYRSNGNEGDHDQGGDVIRTDATKTEYVHKNLRANQMWSYEAYGFNRHGHSKTSSGVVNGESDGPDRPTYPGNVLALQFSSSPAATISNIVNLYWTAPDDGGQDIVRYEIEISDTSSQWPSQAFLDGGTNVPATAAATKVAAAGSPTTGLLNPDPEDTTGSQKNVAVVWVSTDFGNDQVTELGMPYQLRHTYTGSDSDRVAGNDRTAASKLYYRVRTVTGSGSSQMMSAYTEPGASVTIVDATPAADNDPAITFMPPVPAPVLDADADDGVPGGSDATVSDDESNTTPGNGEDDDLVPGEIKLTLTTVVPGADSYRIDVSEDMGATWTTDHDYTLPISRNDYDHRNLKPEERLHFRFFAKDGSDIGLASNVVFDWAGNTDQPGNVRNLVAATHPTDGAGKINLSWDAPEMDGGADIEQYCILVNLLGENDAVGIDAVTRNSIYTKDYTLADNPDGGTDPITANCTRLGESDAKDKNGVMTISVSGDSTVFQVDHDTTMVTFTGLEQKTRWQFEVFALNKASDADVDNDGTEADAIGNVSNLAENGGRHALSEDSDEKKAGTGSALTPMAPQRLTAQLAQDTDPEAIAGGIGNQGVLLLWNPPADPVGAKVISYKIELKSDDGDFETEVATHPVGETHWVDDNELGADETRTYRISAINAFGTGTAMATVMIPYPPTHTTHTTTPAVDELTAPSGVTVSKLRDTVSVTWDPASIENAEQVKVVLFDSGVTRIVDLETFNAANDPGAATFTGVDSGTYKVTVASFRTGDRHKLSALMEVTIE